MVRCVKLNMKKQVYSKLTIRRLSLEPQGNILGISVIDDQSTVVVPRGQEIDEYNFQTTEFIHNWTIKDN